jgi:tRNA(fMet)-specific endonuclease VapC
MENKIILIDTSILIEFFRKTDKAKSILLGLVKQGYIFKIYAITVYEIYIGANLLQTNFWDEFLEKIEVLPLNYTIAKTAVLLNTELKRKRNQIDIADLFIAATAITNNLKIATLNIKHFERIEQLAIVKI